jgi:hypothetical protein
LSSSNHAVKDLASAQVVVPTQVGLAAHFARPSVQLIKLGPSTFLLLVNNLGNMESSYSATIIGTTGPITANLVDLNGNLSQAVPLFRLPGLATGALLLKTTLKGFKSGTVEVQVQSLDNPDLSVTVTATVTASHHRKHRGRRLGPG